MKRFEVSGHVEAAINPNSPLRKSDHNPGTNLSLDPQHVYARNLEVSAGGGVGTAQAMARAYGEFATGGRELGPRQDTLRALRGPAVAPARGFYDECLKVTWQLSLGFVKPSPGWPWMQFGSPSAFVMSGAGGSFAFADPETGVGYAYVMNRMRPPEKADPREWAIRRAFQQAMGRRAKAKAFATTEMSA
jgi:CubicO group peptidase (beta-lactamase class C family)